MDLYTGPGHDHDHHLDTVGAYEWWYVDALSPDGEWGVVVIQFRGMPMSPEYLEAIETSTGRPVDHCGYAVSVYHRTTRVGFAFREIESSSFIPPDGIFEVDTAHPDLPQSIRVRIEVADSPLQDTGVRSGDHGWVLVAPRVQATVSLTLAENGVPMVEAGWTGLAYRDHNFGSHPLHEAFGDWYWGRVHADDRTIVYLAVPDAIEPFIMCGEIGEGASTLSPWADVHLEVDRVRPSIMGLMAGRRVTLIGTDPRGREARLTCHNRHVVEDGPFYQRYLSDWRLDGINLGRGTSEYMRASRLGAAWIRPFLRLPLFRHG